MELDEAIVKGTYEIVRKRCDAQHWPCPSFEQHKLSLQSAVDLTEGLNRAAKEAMLEEVPNAPDD